MTNLQKTPALPSADAYFAQLLAIYDEQSVLSPLEMLLERLDGETLYVGDLAGQIEIDFGDDDSLEMTEFYEDEVVEAMADHADEARYAL